MLSRSLNIALRYSPRQIITQLTAKSSTAVDKGSYIERDPAPYFFNEEVQKLLKTVTRPQPEKVFRRQLDSESLEAPEYKFMTNEQLQKAMRKADVDMWERLQMPPVIKVREEDTRIFSRDPALQGYSEHKYVFTDISFGISNKDRLIYVREPDGTLRAATNEERDRLNQIYFPIQGREVLMPKMFQEEYLEPILDREDYEFILHRACIQFDPDSEDYHRVTQITYDRIDEKLHHDKLRSTRHYGPLVFYLAWNKKIDNILLENITNEKIEDAALVIRLYYKLNPNDKAVEVDDHITLIKHYIETEAVGSKRKLDHALKMYLELEKERTAVTENIKKADGKME